MTDNDSLSSEFQLGKNELKTRHYVILHAFLRQTFLLPAEIWYSGARASLRHVICHHLNVEKSALRPVVMIRRSMS